MNIFDLPWFNQPRNKILKEGAEKLNIAELLAVVFDRGRPGESAIDLGNRLIKTHNLHRLEYLGNQELLDEIRRKRKKPDKEDKIKVAKILALIELAKRYNKLKNEGYKNSISSARDVLYTAIVK